MKLLRCQQCGERVNQVLEELREKMCEMICAHGQECLRLFFFCSSLTGLHYLRELFASGRLKGIVNDIIGTLSSDSRTELWEVVTLVWDENEDEDADRSSNMSQINSEPFQSDTGDQHSNCDDITQSKSVYAFNVEDRIAKFRAQLLEIIDIEYDLLDELLNLRLLTSRQADFIRGGRTTYDQIDELLNSVIKMPKHQQERFLEALTKTRQSHVKDYIVADGVYSAERASNWPLAASQ